MISRLSFSFSQWFTSRDGDCDLFCCPNDSSSNNLSQFWAFFVPIQLWFIAWDVYHKTLVVTVLWVQKGRGGDGPMVRVLTFYSVDLSSILLSLQFYSVKLRQFMMDNNQICCNNWVDAYKPAPPSTKELRGLQLTSRNSNCTQTHSFILWLFNLSHMIIPDKLSICSLGVVICPPSSPPHPHSYDVWLPSRETKIAAIILNSSGKSKHFFTF